MVSGADRLPGRALIVAVALVTCLTPVLGCSRESGRPRQPANGRAHAPTPSPPAATVPGYGVTLPTPPGWERRTVAPKGKETVDLALVGPDGSGLRPTITVIHSPTTDRSLQQGMAREKRELPLDVAVLADKVTTLGGRTAALLEYIDGSDRHVIQYFLWAPDGIEYVVTCTALEADFDKFEPAFRRALAGAQVHLGTP